MGRNGIENLLCLKTLNDIIAFNSRRKTNGNQKLDYYKTKNN